MAIDPMMYQKLSGRKGDPYTRLGEALAKNAKAKSQRDEMPKGVSGGLRTTMWPGLWANLFFWIKNKNREK
jgi:hypothetical protein